jgi:hypothetical protein
MVQKFRNKLLNSCSDSMIHFRTIFRGNYQASPLSIHWKSFLTTHSRFLIKLFSQFFSPSVFWEKSFLRERNFIKKYFIRKPLKYKNSNSEFLTEFWNLKSVEIALKMPLKFRIQMNRISIEFNFKIRWETQGKILNSGVQSKINACHNVNKVENSFIYALILNAIDIVVCVVFALYSRFSFKFKTTVLPRIQLSEYYSNFQNKMFKSPKHLMTFCRRIRIVLTELYSG